MKSSTLLNMDALDMSAVSTMEAMIRFVALLDFHGVGTMEAMDDKLASLMEQAEDADEYAFFEAAKRLVRNRTDNRTGGEKAT